MEPKSAENTQRKRQVKPVEIMYMLLLLNVLLGAVVILFPEGKITVGDWFTLKSTPLSKIFTADTTKIVDVKEVIKGVETVDTTLEYIAGSATFKLQNEKIEVPLNRVIQYPDNTQMALKNFFDALVQTENTGKLMHIIHYGDSQLEGDRISDYLRNKMQLIFGGYGPGVVLPMDVSHSRVSVLQNESADWQKYAIYGKTNKADQGKYGLGGSSYRYTGNGRRKIGTDTVIQKMYIKTASLDSIKVPSGLDTPKFAMKNVVVERIDSSKYYYDTLYKPKYEVIQNQQSWLKFNCAKNSFPRVRKFNQIKVLYSSTSAIDVKVHLDDSIRDINFPIAPVLGVKTLKPGFINKGISFSFAGGESPYFYGFVFEGDSGVQIDNFPMRGSSGTGFESINPSLLVAQYKALNAKLIILQYGINVVPNPQKNYDYYQRLFSAQLAAIKRAAPDMSVLVIGPSDMSTRIDGVYASYPNITLIRDAMQKAAFANNCAFWDLYAAMGGQNSMVSWVNDKPALAGKDFTHFTPKGAQYVGEMLYDALIKEYLRYKQVQ